MTKITETLLCLEPETWTVKEFRALFARFPEGATVELGSDGDCSRASLVVCLEREETEEEREARVRNDKARQRRYDLAEYHNYTRLKKKFEVHDVDALAALKP